MSLRDASALLDEVLALRSDADAAMAERAEGVLLAKEPYAEAAVRSLADVLCRMHRHRSKKTARLGVMRAWEPEP
jgi:Ser/Thr protein kinase RdoA (MazF antagonist)